MATTSRQRVPAAQRRDALIDAAVEEFAHGGLHATPVDRIARRVGVAQPYVFSLFPTKKELFIAAVERGYERVQQHFMDVPEPTLGAIGDSYLELIALDRNLLMLQLHGYTAACEDPEIAGPVREAYGRLVAAVQARTGATDDEMAEFSAIGAYLSIHAAMGAPDLESACAWIKRGHETRSD